MSDPEFDGVDLAQLDPLPRWVITLFFVDPSRPPVQYITTHYQQVAQVLRERSHRYGAMRVNFRREHSVEWYEGVKTLRVEVNADE